MAKVANTNRIPARLMLLLSAGSAALLAGGCIYASRDPGEGYRLGIGPPPVVEVDPNVVLPVAIGLGIIASEIWGRGGRCR
jgi:hypothetical protein